MNQLPAITSLFLAGALVTSPGLGHADERRADLAGTLPLDRVQGDEGHPRDRTGADLARRSRGADMSRNPRLNLLAGVSWTPGLPGGGGGSGGPWEPAVAPSYTVGDALPCLEDGVACTPFGSSRNGRWIVGSSRLSAQGLSPCPDETGERPSYSHVSAVLWELDSAGVVVGIEELPNPLGIAAGKPDAIALATDGRSLIVGRSFLRWKSDDCTHRDANVAQLQPVAWERQPDESWRQVELPHDTVDAEPGGATAASFSGWIAGYLGFGSGAEPETVVPGPVVWIPGSRAGSGRRLERLPTPPDADHARARMINEAGVISGIAEYGLAGGAVRRAAVVWRRDLFGNWNYTELDTLGGEDAEPNHLTDDGRLLGCSDTGILDRERPSDELVERVHAAEWQLDWTSGTWMGPEDHGTIGGYESLAESAAGSRLVVGSSTIDPRDATSDRAVAWGPDGALQLDTATQGSWTFTHAPLALPNGCIIVNGFEGRNGAEQYFVLQPVD